MNTATNGSPASARWGYKCITKKNRWKQNIGKTNDKKQMRKSFIDCYTDFTCSWLWEDSLVSSDTFLCKIVEELSVGKIQRQYLEWYPEDVTFPPLVCFVSPKHSDRMFCKRQQSSWRNVERGVIFYTIREPYALEFNPSNHSRKIAGQTFQALLTHACTDLTAIQALVLGYTEKNWSLNSTQNKDLLEKGLWFNIQLLPVQEHWLAHVVVHSCVLTDTRHRSELLSLLNHNRFTAAVLLVVQEEVCGPSRKKAL